MALSIFIDFHNMKKFIIKIKFFITYHIFILFYRKNIISSLMDQYKLEYEKGSGTFSVVFTALSLKTGKHVAIKCMKKKFDSL